MAVPSPSRKSALREAALEARRDYARALAPETRRALEEAVADLVLPHLAGAGIVAGYHPLRDEISPFPLLARLAPGQQVAFPWFADRDARMTFRAGPAAEPGPWGVLQPAGTAEALAPDLVLVPLVAADRRGTRIGHGKGHYDRAIAHLRESGRQVLAIGLGWEPQLLDGPIPPDPWDMALDAVATPKEWFDCR